MGMDHKVYKGSFIKAMGNLRLHWLPEPGGPLGWANVEVRLERLTADGWVPACYHGDPDDLYSRSGFELDDLKPRDLVGMELSVLRDAIEDGEWFVGDPRLLDDEVRVFGPRQSIKIPGVEIPVVMDDAGMNSYFGSSDPVMKQDILVSLRYGEINDLHMDCKPEWNE